MTEVGGLLSALLPASRPGRATPIPVIQAPASLGAAAGPQRVTATVMPGAAQGRTVLDTAEGALTLAAALPHPPGSRLRLELRTDPAGRLLAVLVGAAPGAAPPATAEAGPDLLRLVFLGRGGSGDDAAAVQPKPGDVLHVRPAPAGSPAVAEATARAPLAATVVRAAPGGGLLLATRWGLAALPSDAVLRPGMLLALPIVAAPLADAPAKAAAQILADLGRDWENLRTGLRALAEARPALAGPLLAALPRPGPQMLKQILRFVAAVRIGDIAQWLGPEAAAALAAPEAGGSLERIGEDFARMTRLSHSDGDWRAYLVPICAGSGPQQMRLYVRRRDRSDGDRPAEAPSRFVVEVDLSRIGALQFDGLYRSRQIDLIVRSAARLAPDLEADLRRLFDRSLAEAGLTGAIRFDPEACFIAPLVAVAQPGKGVRV